MHGFESFYRSSRQPALRAVSGVVGDADRAQEAVAEAFARALERWPALSRHPNPLGWVVLTALNLERSRWRRLGPRYSSVPVVPDVVAPTAAAPFDDQLLRLLKALPRRQREVVALRVLLDLTGPQAADLLGISAGAVSAHLHRGLSTLRAALKPERSPEASHD